MANKRMKDIVDVSEGAGDFFISEEEKDRQRVIKKRITSETKKFMKNVRDFIKAKNGGAIPLEWSMSLTLLETYLRQFLACTYELEDLPSVIVESRYGPTPHPLLKVQNTAAVRLEKMMSELGLSMKSAKKLEVAKPVEAESPLDKFIKKVEKR